MRKVLSVIFLLLLLEVISINIVFAKATPRVYSEVTTFIEKTVNVPIKIENNEGLMGYKFSITTDNAELIEISQGDDFSDGIFNSKITNENSSGEIIWTNSTEINNDGTLFYLSLKIKDLSSNCVVKLTYSKSDTFNGNYDEIDISCDSIIINSAENNDEATRNNVTYDNQKDEEFILEYINKVDAEDIKTTINSALERSGATSVSKLTNEQKEIFIEAFDDIISSEYEKLPLVNKNYSSDKGVSIIEEILDCTEEYTVKSFIMPSENEVTEPTENIASCDEVEKSKENNINYVWLIAILSSVVVIVAILICTKKLKKKGENKNE